jgi:hypothetical protein
MTAEETTATWPADPGSSPARGEPGPEELTEALVELAGDAQGAVPVGAAELVARRYGWRGRLIEVLDVVTEDGERMGYLAGGRRPDEVMTWTRMWAASPLTVTQIRTVTAAGGWDPEPFVAIAGAGLLERLVTRPDGTPRRVRGELAGAWVSDELSLADDQQVLDAVLDELRSDVGG